MRHQAWFRFKVGTLIIFLLSLGWTCASLESGLELIAEVS